MAGVSQGHDKGDSLNTELNLVPFIDLLSSLVMFLLVTAVWVQISVIPASVQGHGEAAAPSTTATPENRTVIRVTAAAYELYWPASAKNLAPRVLKKGNAYDTDALVALLNQATKSGTLTEAAVSAEESVEYGAVIKAIDAAKAGGFKMVALSTN